MYNPWRDAANYGLPVYLYPLGPLSGATDGERIWLAPDLTWTESRCTLTHKLEHIRAGHTGHQNETRERTIRWRTSRRLVPLPALLERVTSQESIDDIADSLQVTTSVLVDRWDCITDTERLALRRAAIR